MGLMLSLREIFTHTIDATPTPYRGVEMRSKLEADFAYHLDVLRVPWSYEPELFGPRGEGYLPDFLLQQNGGRCYAELKPTLAQATEAKARMEVIWDRRPEATLLVVVAEGNWFFAAIRGGQWEAWQESWRHS